MVFDIFMALFCVMVSVLALINAEEWWQYGISLFGVVMAIIIFVMSF